MNYSSLGTLVLLLCAACGDDSSGVDAGRADSGRVDGGRADGGGTDGGGDDDAGEPTDAGGDDGGGTDAGMDSGSTPTEPPVITRVAWMTSRPCAAGSSSTFTITIDVTDADTPAGSLTYMGSVGGCAGMLNANPATISCPNLAPYMGNVTVRDPEGNSDAQSFTFGPCSDGEVLP